jgi:hypothetical protein
LPWVIRDLAVLHRDDGISGFASIGGTEAHDFTDIVGSSAAKYWLCARGGDDRVAADAVGDTTRPGGDGNDTPQSGVQDASTLVGGAGRDVPDGGRGVGGVGDGSVSDSGFGEVRQVAEIRLVKSALIRFADQADWA